MNRYPHVVGPDAAPDPIAMRWPHGRLVLLLMAICFLAHFNRVSMAVAADLRIMPQYEISATLMGSVYSAFLIAYTVLMIPGGWLIDRYGTRFSLQVVCFGSAAFVVLTGCVGWGAASAGVVFSSLVLIRSAMGAISVPLHPAAAKSVCDQIPPLARSAANGLVTGAALLGVASTYLLFGSLVDWLDWPAAFAVAGACTAVVGALWTRWATEVPDLSDAAHFGRPEIHPSGAAILLPRSWPGFRSFLSGNRNLALLTLSYAAVGYFQYLFFYWMHYYFESILQLGAQESRLYAVIPPLTMAVGMPPGGWLSDRVQSRFGRRAARAGLASGAMAASAALLVLGTMATQPFWIVAWLSLALGVLGMAEGPFWVSAVEVGGRRGGLSASIFNTGGNAGGIVAPVVTPWISETLGFGWQAGIGVGGAVCLLGAVMWLGIDFDAAESNSIESLEAPLGVRAAAPAQTP